MPQGNAKWFVLVLSILLMPAVSASTQECDESAPYVIPAGYDLFETMPFETHHTLVAAPGMIVPGSQAFSQTIILRGAPLRSYEFPDIGVVEELGTVDTIVRRTQCAQFQSIGESATVHIVVEAISFESLEPLTVPVEVDGQIVQQLWDVRVELSPILSSEGSMTITLDSEEGGYFTSDFQIRPALFLTRRSDGLVVELPPLVVLNFTTEGTAAWTFEHEADALVIPQLNEGFAIKGLTEAERIARHYALYGRPSGTGPSPARPVKAPPPAVWPGHSNWSWLESLFGKLIPGHRLFVLHLNLDFDDATWLSEQTRELFRTRQFRTALASSIDRQYLAELLAGRTGNWTSAAWSLISPHSPFYGGREAISGTVTESDAVRHEFNLDFAAHLLDNVGLVDHDGDGWRDLPTGEEFRFSLAVPVNPEDPSGMDTDAFTIGQYVSEWFRSVGIYTVVHESETLSAMLLYEPQYVQASIIEMVAPYDPFALWDIYHSSGRFHFWRPDAVWGGLDALESSLDDTLKRAASTLDPDEAFAAYKEWQIVMADQSFGFIPILIDGIPLAAD